MKYLFLSLLLLSIPAQANKTYSKKECLEIRNAIAAKFSGNKMRPPRDLMAHYAQMCIPSYKDDPEQATLFDAAIFDELVAAITTKHAQHDLLKL